MPCHRLITARALLMLAASAPLAQGAVYKCQMPDGSVHYQQIACESAATGSEVAIRPAAGGSAAPDYDRYSVMNQVRAFEAETAIKRARRVTTAAAVSQPSGNEIRDARVEKPMIWSMYRDDGRRLWHAPRAACNGGYASWRHRPFVTHAAPSGRPVIVHRGKFADRPVHPSRYPLR